MRAFPEITTPWGLWAFGRCPLPASSPSAGDTASCRQTPWTDGWKYVDFFERNRPRMLPFRIIILDGNGVCRMNSPCSVDQFEWHVKRNGDISYSLTLREYRFISGAK